MSNQALFQSFIKDFETLKPHILDVARKLATFQEDGNFTYCDPDTIAINNEKEFVFNGDEPWQYGTPVSFYVPFEAVEDWDAYHAELLKKKIEKEKRDAEIKARVLLDEEEAARKKRKYTYEKLKAEFEGDAT